MDIQKLLIRIDHWKPDLLTNWRWLVWGDIPLFYTVTWDIISKHTDWSIYWLTSCDWDYNKIAEDINSFVWLLWSPENIQKIFLTDIIEIFYEKIEKFEYWECLSYIKPPILGWEYESDNLHISQIEVHLWMLWDILFQIKDSQK